MASTTDIRERMSALFAEAKSQGLNVIALLPPEIQTRLTKPETPKPYVFEDEPVNGDTPNNEYTERIAALTLERDEAIQIAETARNDFAQLEVDYKQLTQQVSFYKSLLESEQRSTKSLTEKYQAALKQRIENNADTQTLDRLEAQVKDQQDIIGRLADSLRQAHDTLDIAHQERASEVAVLNAEVVKLATQLADLANIHAAVEEEGDEIIATYQDFLAKVEEDRQHDEVALNEWSVRVQNSFRYQAAALSEAKALHNYFNRLEDVLVMYENILHQLLSMKTSDVRWSPDLMHQVIRSAQLECDTFDVVHGMFEVEARDGDEVFGQLTDMSVVAKNLQRTTCSVGKDLERFLFSLRERPGVWGTVKGKFGVLFRAVKK